MKYFLVLGEVIKPEKVDEKLMKEHKEYTKQLMDKGEVLFSSLKEDMSGSVTVVKGKEKDSVYDFYGKEPFYREDVVKYNISEIDIHYFNDKNWFEM